MNEIASRYGNALFLLGKEKNTLLEYQEEVKTLIKIINDHPDFINVLNSGFLSKIEKKEILEKTFTGINKDIINCLKIVIDNNRAYVLKDVLYSFNSFVNQSRGVKEGFIYSTISLDEKTMEKITIAISEIEHCPLFLKNVIEPNLIGGVKVVVNDHVYDGSIKNKLETMRSTLLRKE